MITVSEERRATGPLIAFIDLLFLLVAFFVLVLFFVQQRKSDAEVHLEQAQQQLQAVQAEKSAVERVLEEVQPFVGEIQVMRKAAEERRRAEEARALRKRQKETFRLDYEVLPGNLVRYEGRAFAVERFAADVVEPLREQYWIGFRALARPDTPFGQVVHARRVVLEHQQEFDTYWDNLTPNAQNP
jgi:biopolymer transport protein ExbD